MRGIELKKSIELFGFKDGISFWFRWSFIDPIETFVWLYVTHKPYCLREGFFCTDGRHKKLFTRKEIFEHWKSQVIE